MRPSRAVAACAVTALAMVFSVQQGEHGPLVVYKLQVPKTAAPVASVPAPARLHSAAAPAIPESNYAIPSRAPHVLGTVVMPVRTAAPLPEEAPSAPLLSAILDGVALPANAVPQATESYAGVPLRVPDSATVLSIVENAPIGEAMINNKNGDVLTLKHVNDAVAWRRDTAEKLRHLPITPRF